MFQQLLLETLHIQDGKVQALEYHTARMRASLPHAPQLDLHIPEEFQRGKVKCRVTYNEQIQEVTYSHYSKPVLNSVKLVEAPTIHYALKYANREPFNQLLKQFPTYDDLIIVQEGKITDATFANVVIDFQDTLLTPAKPLLHGTMRRQLLERGLIITADITPHMLKQAKNVFYINAMNQLGELKVRHID